MMPLHATENGIENGTVDGWDGHHHDAGAMADFAPDFSPDALVVAAARCRERVHILRSEERGTLGVSFADRALTDAGTSLVASLEPVYPEWLGAMDFLETHAVRFPYVSGAMAHGIASRAMVTAMARAELLSFFGAAGLALDDVEASVVALQHELSDREASWGSDLIHTPHDPSIEEKLVEIYLRHRVRRVSASAFMRLTPAVVRFACTGLSLAPDGAIQRQNHLFAKLSRPETARLFMSPAPADIVASLVQRGQLTATEAELAAHVPLAEDITVEADSGGHTDNRPLTALLPAIIALRSELRALHGRARPIRIGAGGGIGTPAPSPRRSRSAPLT